MAGMNPFEQGRAAALAGKSWKGCPFKITQREFTRWNCGFQSGLDEVRRAEAAKAKAAKQVQEVGACAGR